MSKKYILPDTAVRALKRAKKNAQNVYIYGATTYGKTFLIESFLGNKKYTYVSSYDSNWDELLLPEKLEDIVVVDDLQFLDPEKRAEVDKLLDDYSIWTILIGRSPTPSWLRTHCMSNHLTVITEEMLELSPQETLDLAQKEECTLSRQEAESVNKACKGSPYLINYYITLIKQGAEIGPNTHKQLLDACTDLLTNKVFPQWPDDLLRFLYMLSIVPEFTEEMAAIITGEAYTRSYLDRFAEIGNLLFVDGNGVYRIRLHLLYALEATITRKLTSEEISMLQYNAGLYYEMKGDLVNAAKLYSTIGNREKLRNVLDKNVRLTPNAGFYHELSSYYTSFSQNETTDPILIAGISMTYSIMLQPEKSEEWYSYLKQLCKQSEKGNDEYEIWLLYLDVCLPHRVNADVLSIIKAMPKVAFNKNITMPSFAVTSNMPGIMNGGLDLSSWSKMDRELKLSIGWILEKMCGDYGRGLSSAALAESLYERGEDLYEIMSLISRAQVEAENGGKPDILFAMVGLEGRMNILQGRTENAILLIDHFINRNKNGNAKLLANAYALRCRFKIVEGNETEVRDWVDNKAPDENEPFFTMERYRYITKARAYIMLGELQSAYKILEKMIYYTQLYNRRCMRIESLILMSIVKERLSLEWKNDMEIAIELASEYHFTRIFAEEGSAILPLLNELAQNNAKMYSTHKKFFADIISEAEPIAKRNPNYLYSEKKDIPTLSEKGLEVLRLQAENITREEIAKRLNVSVDDVKYHIRQNYKKLGVDNKTDAILTAYKYRLL